MAPSAPDGTGRFPRHTRWLVAAAVTLAACGGRADAPVAPVVSTARELAALRLTVPEVLPVGDTVVASARGFDQVGQPMTIGDVAWTVSDAALLTVRTNGTLLAMAPGTVTVDARIGTVVGHATVRLSPTTPPYPVRSLVLTPGAASLEVGRTLSVTASAFDYADRPLTGRGVTWRSSDTTRATVTASGMVSARARGSVLIDALCEGQHAALSLEVTPAVDPDITVNIPAPLPNTVAGDTLLLQVTASGPFPITEVIASAGGKDVPLRYAFIGSPSRPAPGWTVTMSLASLPYAPYVLVVTAVDTRGHMGVATLPFVRNPSLSGGSKGASANK